MKHVIKKGKIPGLFAGDAAGQLAINFAWQSPTPR